MLCEVCEKTEAKYKCPICRFQYCSVVCYKTHKERCMGVATAAAANEACSGDSGPQLTSTVVQPSAPVEHQVATAGDFGGMMDRVSADPAVVQWLASDRLKQTVRSIHAASDPMSLLQQHLQDPEFQMFAQSCLDARDRSATL
eukprot:ANDGO_01584.mRNA.1 putative zinc-finger protein C4F10.19c